MSRPRNLAFGLAAGAMLSLFVFSLPEVVSRLSYAVQAGQAFAARDEIPVQDDLSAAFKRAARIARPSVVHITSTRRAAAAVDPREPGTPGRSPFDFFGPNPFEGPGGGESRGIGTGVIVRENGYVLTNNHVVAGATEVDVKLSDGRTLEAKVMGTDEKTDLAVVKVEATGLVAAELGDSDRVEIGEWVLAMGNPFGLEHTVTAGIISAKGRANVGIADYEDFLQTDAAINPGNSGGPLLNLEGKVIGINTAIASRTGTYMGVGFAIPISMAQAIMEQIIKDGKVIRGFIGAMIQDLSPEMARSFEFEGKEGVLVGSVVAGGPAAKAGLRDGDIVLEVNGRKVASPSQLRNAVAGTPPGTRIPLKVFREGKERTVEVEIGDLAGQGPPGSAGSEAARELGMSLETLTPEVARQLGEENARGVVVTGVDRAGAAARAGLQRGDLIVAAGNRQVNDLADFRKAMEGADLARGVRLQVLREGVKRFVIVKA